jgi:hypothetical protein
MTAVFPGDEQAACIDQPPAVFFPHGATGRPRRGQYVYDRYARARLVCATCPVIDACRAYALDADERYGMWGGLDPQERWEIRIHEPPQRQCIDCAEMVIGQAQRCRRCARVRETTRDRRRNLQRRRAS